MKLSLCSIEYINKYSPVSKPIIYLFCRDENYKKYIIEQEFSPYFYIEERDLSIVQNNFSNRIYKIGKRGITIDNEKVVQIYTRFPFEVKTFRDILKKNNIRTFEADILFVLRYLIDKEIYSGIEYNIYTSEVKPISQPSRLKYFCIDIEVLAETNDFKSGDYPIIVFGIYNSYDKEIVIFTTLNCNYSVLNKILLDSNIKLSVKYYSTEKELLLSVIEYFKSKDPDIILTFTSFDMKYTILRMKKLELPYKKLSPIEKVNLYQIKGIQILDITEMFATTLRRSKWETLEFISKQELGIDTLYHDRQVYDMWKNNEIDKILKRNLRDVELVKLLNEELQLLTYFDTIRRVVGCNISDALIRSRIQDILDLRMARKYNVILPTRRFYYHYDYEGAMVFKCITGIFRNVLVVDFKAMYPSLIKAFNIGYTTFIKTTMRQQFIEVEDLKNRFKTSNIPSFVVEELNMLEPIREPYKQKLKELNGKSSEYKKVKAISDAIKSVINSLYGKFGYSGNWEEHIPAARLYEPSIAAAVTKAGRVCQQVVFEYLEKIGKKILYGDTDSLFIKLETDNIQKESEELVNNLNSYLETFLKEEYNVKKVELKLEIDKIFSTLVLLTKKRYAGKRIDGSYEWKGLEMIKRDQAIVTQEVQENLLKKILDNESNIDILNYFFRECDNFNKRTIEEIAIPLRLDKRLVEYKSPSYHLKAFIYSKNILNIDLKEGERFYLIYIKEVPKDYPSVFTVETKYIEPKQYKVEAIAFKSSNDIPKGFIIDYEKMKDKTIINKSKDILKLLNINLSMLEKRARGYRTLIEFR
jgi:DNA polymerase elongation subunit (family B)